MEAFLLVKANLKHYLMHAEFFFLFWVSFFSWGSRMLPVIIPQGDPRHALMCISASPVHTVTLLFWTNSIKTNSTFDRQRRCDMSSGVCAVWTAMCLMSAALGYASCFKNSCVSFQCLSGLLFPSKTSIFLIYSHSTKFTTNVPTITEAQQPVYHIHVRLQYIYS